MDITNQVAIGWCGMPAYAARLMQSVNGPCVIVATRPTVPIEGMDQLLPNRINWVGDDYKGGWRGLGLKPPSLFIQPSWSTPCFNLLGQEVIVAGGRVVVMFDNSWRSDLRQFLGAAIFRTFWRGRFSAAWVPGRASRKLALFWGFRPEYIYEGLYGAAPVLFSENGSMPLIARPQRILFVGQLVERKGVVELLEAWREFHMIMPNWELHVYGNGPLESIARRSSVVFHGFQQPEAIAVAMKNSRFLILPSHEEHWGLVVCEAAQAGCGLLLSDAVGSHHDLLTADNGYLFKANCIEGIRNAFLWATKVRSPSELEHMERASRRVGAEYTPDNFSKTFSRIIADMFRGDLVI